MHLAGTLCLLLLTSVVHSRNYGRCELAKYLLAKNVPKNQLNDWVCLATAESNRNSNAKGSENWNGSREYGIFQINSYYWCSGGEKSKFNECKVSCNALLDDNIENDVKCALFIYKRHKFAVWVGWKNKCKGRDMSKYTKYCKL